jgi:hypothetical protein
VCPRIFTFKTLITPLPSVTAHKTSFFNIDAVKCSHLPTATVISALLSLSLQCHSQNVCLCFAVLVAFFFFVIALQRCRTDFVETNKSGPLSVRHELVSVSVLHKYRKLHYSATCAAMSCLLRQEERTGGRAFGAQMFKI